jgi:hypothetical protein
VQRFIVVFDLWGKINSGYFEGNRFSLGHFSQCLDFRHEIGNEVEEEKTKVQGQYCLLLAVPLPNSTIKEQSDGFDWREV